MRASYLETAFGSMGWAAAATASNPASADPLHAESPNTAWKSNTSRVGFSEQRSAFVMRRDYCAVVLLANGFVLLCAIAMVDPGMIHMALERDAVRLPNLHQRNV